MVKIGRGAPCRIATGQYTGDGTESHPITGVGFKPRYVHVWGHLAVPGSLAHSEKVDQMHGDLCQEVYTSQIVADRIISLDVDGFTVDAGIFDDHPNKNGQVYDFICFG